MDKIRIKGNSSLYGKINVCGSKNAALPILVSSLLSNNDLILKNIPKLEDIKSMINLLKGYGVSCIERNNTLILNANKINNNVADYDLVRKMRASILILGPLLARFKKANISLPGGCAIGTRPIDIHLDALSKLGVIFKIENGFVKAVAPKTLIGNKINLSFPSVGATQNVLMAASLAKGTTIINNPAKEPEIIDLASSVPYNFTNCAYDWMYTLGDLQSLFEYSSANNDSPCAFQYIEDDFEFELCFESSGEFNNSLTYSGFIPGCQPNNNNNNNWPTTLRLVRTIAE